MRMRNEACWLHLFTPKWTYQIFKSSRNIHNNLQYFLLHKMRGACTVMGLTLSELKGCDQSRPSHWCEPNVFLTEGQTMWVPQWSFLVSPTWGIPLKPEMEPVISRSRGEHIPWVYFDHQIPAASTQILRGQPTEESCLKSQRWFHVDHPCKRIPRGSHVRTFGGVV